jgi:hypothetical protein
VITINAFCFLPCFFAGTGINSAAVPATTVLLAPALLQYAA